MYKYYSRELANRFVNDYKLPISLTNEETFEHFLDVFEKTHKARTRYEKLVELIETTFNGSASDFLKVYYDARDRMITSIEESDTYKAFKECDMNVYSFNNSKVKDVQKGDVFNEDNIGKTFISIDMSKANFQAMKWAGVLADATYNDFVSRFTDLDYIKDSKYIREVVFGKCCASRQITIERYIMFTSVFLVLNDSLERVFGLKLVRFNNDELIYEDIQHKFNFELPEAKPLFESFKEVVTSTIDNVDLRIEGYTLQGYHYKNERTKNYKPAFFVKKKNDGTREIVKIPQVYAPIAYQSLINKTTSATVDKCFQYEDMICAFLDDLTLEEILN